MTITTDFIRDGYHVLPAGVHPTTCDWLLTKIKATRAFDARLFLTEAEFDADPQHKGVNPRPGRNLLEKLLPNLVVGWLTLRPPLVELLGDDYEVLDQKIVCGLPASALPHWVQRRIAGNLVNNLGAYMRPEYRDITYFHGIDFHQDLIDHPGREADFVTLYVYLHPVGLHDAPLYVLEGSHKLGATIFPHDLKYEGGVDCWRYQGRANHLLARTITLTGDTGFAAMWHPCALHGTQAADNLRLSLRYLFAKRPGVKCGLDAVNATLEGPLSLSDTRRDLDERGAARVKA